MLLLSSKNIHIINIIIFLNSLSKGPQNFSTLKQIISLDIGIKCIINDYNQGHIIWELHTWGQKKEFLSLVTLISCNLHDGNFWKIFRVFSKQFTTRSYGYICPKMYFFLKFGTYIRNDNIGAFFRWKHSQKPLGVIGACLKSLLGYPKSLIEGSIELYNHTLLCVKL